MDVSNKKTFSRHKFVSVGLFLTLAVLVITAVVIQIFEAREEDLNMHLFLVAHIFTGLTFTVLSVLHIIIHWQSMKIYIKGKKMIVSREALYAFLLTIVAIFVGFLFVFVFLY